MVGSGSLNGNHDFATFGGLEDCENEVDGIDGVEKWESMRCGKKYIYTIENYIIVVKPIKILTSSYIVI